MKRLTVWLVIAAYLLLGASVTTQAQDYPNRPIEMLVGFAAGGITDLTARVIQTEMSATLGQPIIVESRTGPGRNIATAELARAAPDGYTIMVASPGQLIVNPLTHRSPGFDPKTVFTPIGIANTSPFVFVVPAASKFKSVAELVSWGKAHPGALTFGSPGIDTTMHVAGEMLQAYADISAVHVHYRGGAAATTDLVAGRMDFMIDSLGSVSAQIDAGALRVLTVLSHKRINRFADEPTLVEIYPDFEVSSGLGVVAPPGLPPAVTAKLVNALVRAVAGFSSPQLAR